MIKATLPRDGNRIPLQNSTLQGTTLASTYDASIDASTEIELQAGTTSLTVTAISEPVLLRWGTGDASTSAFDAIVPAGQTYFFAVPQGTTAVNVIEATASAAVAVVEK